MGALAVVFDTNVLVSALGFGGNPLDALLRAFDPDIDILATDVTLAELDRVLRYDRLPIDEAEREQFLAIVVREVEFVVPDEAIEVVAQDPDDNRFLECAIAGDAAYIVSGDSHLLDLGSFQDIEMVTPTEFLRRVP